MDPNSIYNTNQAKSVKDKAKLLSVYGLCLICIVYGMIFLKWRSKPIPRKGASSHRTKSSKRNTKHKSKDKKKRLKRQETTICWWLTTN